MLTPKEHALVIKTIASIKRLAPDRQGRVADAISNAFHEAICPRCYDARNTRPHVQGCLIEG